MDENTTSYRLGDIAIDAELALCTLLGLTDRQLISKS